MTKTEIHKIGSRVHIEILGHAGYSAAGSDIVCAGISALALSFGKLCLDYAKDGRIIINECDSSDGSFIIDYTDKDYITDGPLKMLEIGLREIADKHKEYASYKAE